MSSVVLANNRFLIRPVDGGLLVQDRSKDVIPSELPFRGSASLTAVSDCGRYAAVMTDGYPAILTVYRREALETAWETVFRASIGETPHELEWSGDDPPEFVLRRADEAERRVYSWVRGWVYE